MSMSIHGVFYDRHAACMHGCMQGVDAGQSSVDAVLSGVEYAVDALNAACMSIVKYA